MATSSFFMHFDRPVTAIVTDCIHTTSVDVNLGDGDKMHLFFEDRAYAQRLADAINAASIEPHAAPVLQAAE